MTMTRQINPRIRSMMNLMDYTKDTNTVPEPMDVLSQAAFHIPGYPQGMQGMMMSDEMTPENIRRITSRRETRGMREHWYKVKGPMTVLRLLSEELHDKITLSNTPVAPGAIFDAITKGNYKRIGIMVVKTSAITSCARRTVA